MRSWTIQPGDTLAGALGRLYVYGQTQRDVLGAFTKLRDPTKLQAGWRVQGRFASAGLMDASSLRSVVIAPPQGEGITIVRTDDGAFSAEEGGVAGSLQRQAVRCVLTGPLGNSLHRCGEGEGLVGLVESVLASRIQPAPAPQPGDELRLVYDKLMDGDHLVRYQRLVAIQLRSPRALGAEADAADATGASAEQAGAAAHRFTAVWFEDDRTSGWFDLSGTSREPLLDLHPVQVGRFTSGFGMRLHPVLHRMKAHQGVDYAAPRGTPIGSAGSGVVLTARAAGAAGNLVRIRHDQGYVTEYMHLQRFAGGLSAGQRIRKGQIIGYVGTTGRSTGPHLHFGIKHHGNYLDPLRMPAVPQAGVGTKSRKSFDETRDDALRLLHALDRAGGQRS
jgi:murein DD-endopeptidase MepM/ murein hydrolase activator NlpD